MNELLTLTPAWTFAGGSALGAVIGSFAAVVAERLPQRRSLGGRSTCACGRQLRAVENIPILGWLSAGGRAGCCGAAIPLRYLLWEVASAAAAGAAALVLGPAGAGGAAAGVVAVAAAAGLADRRAAEAG